MKISSKARLLRLVFSGLDHQRAEAHHQQLDIIYEFLDEIGDYFKAHLPDINQIYGNGVITEMKHLTEELFKDRNSPARKQIDECIGRLTLAASFIPDKE